MPTPASSKRKPSTQKTLSFTTSHSHSSSSKISKANKGPSPKNPSRENSLLPEPFPSSKPGTSPLKEVTSSTPEPLSSSSSSSSKDSSILRPKPQTPTPTPTPLENHHLQLASKVTPAKIRQYWKQREELRLAPRVHQKELDISEKVLREWDCMSQFGPSIGIPRTHRWHRASKLGLNPPIEVLAVLLKEEEKKNGAVERAYVDVLMN